MSQQEFQVNLADLSEMKWALNAVRAGAKHGGKLVFASRKDTEAFLSEMDLGQDCCQGVNVLGLPVAWDEKRI